MRVFLDTNILLSASLFPNGVAAKAYDKAVSSPNEAFASDYVIEELGSVFNRKFPAKTDTLNVFIAMMASTVGVVITPEEKAPEEGRVRDPKDRPVLRGALSAKSDVLLTGDKDLLESGVQPPQILSPSDFLAI